MADFSVVFDPMLDKERAEFENGSGGSGGSSYVGGERINIAGGTISFVNSADIVNVTGTSVTLQPNTAYKMYATTGALNVTANPPAANKWAYEGHAEIFVGSVGYVVFDTSKIVLANQIEPDSVNNCTLRFHDGMCYVSVEDHVAGYIVVNGSASGDGSLYYGITTSTNDYVAFDASLNGTTIPLAGATAEGEKHIVGNGYSETTLTGAVDCGTSKFTVANLALSDVQVAGGTLTLGDAYIPSGSTVAVSGGGLAIEKVTGNGGVIDLGSGFINAENTSVEITGCTINGGSAGTSGAQVFAKGSASANISGVTFDATAWGGGGYANCVAGIVTGGYFPQITLTSCTFVGSGMLVYLNGTKATLSNCTMPVYAGTQINLQDATASMTLVGSNRIGGQMLSYGKNGNLIISSGAIVDLTNNPISSPLFRTTDSATITFGANVTIITSAGESVSLNGGVAGTCSVIHNDGTTE